MISEALVFRELALLLEADGLRLKVFYFLDDFMLIISFLQTKMHTTPTLQKNSRTSPMHTKFSPIPKSVKSTINMARKDWRVVQVVVA